MKTRTIVLLPRVSSWLAVCSPSRSSGAVGTEPTVSREASQHVGQAKKITPKVVKSDEEWKRS